MPSAVRKRCLILVAALSLGAAALPSAVWAQQVPTAESVLAALQEMGLGLDGLQVRNALATDSGGTALLQLAGGTLVDLRLVAAESGWSVRDISLIAGSVDTFHGWSQPWTNRVQAAENFLAGMDGVGGTRQAEELATLSWFEDPDASARLWGMNPVTYRMMQTLQMMPSLSGPTGGGTNATNPVPRR